MERYNRGAGAASAPTPPSAPANPYFTEGNPSLGVPATQPGPWWFHMITEEMRKVITDAGLTPDHTDLTQLSAAIQAMIINGQKSVIIHDAVFEASVADEDVVYWHAGNGEFTKAVADGSAAQNAVGFADVTNEKVYAFGSAPIFSGLTPGAYYLDGTTPGAITSTPPAANIVKLGLAVSATEIYVDIDGDAYQIASDAQAQAFTAGKLIDGAKLNTALKGSNQSLTTNGYQKLPGGLIIQWGYSASGNDGKLVTLPITYPNAHLLAMASDFGESSAQSNAVGVSAHSLSQIRVSHSGGSGSAPLYWLSIGY
jgi:hypothetical protein